VNEQTNCAQCGKPPEAFPWYHLSYNNERHHFCSRICLIDFMAPEVKKAIVVKQWIPTPEEEERMRQ